jgi:tRNA nucleotidyltransferase (CCA-adding enzyme)
MPAGGGPRQRAAPRLDPPGAVRDIAARLEQEGFETWCVGGAVRDALLGLPHLDWDLATAARPEEVRRLFRRSVPVGEQFGTIGVLDQAGVMHEVTTFRRDVKTDGRHAEVEFGASLDEDLARRDFTINAIAWSPSQHRLHDPFDGREDLRRGLVRAVGDARTRMREDRLRALRALRFAGRFGFAIDEATWDAIVESAGALHRLSMERVQQELVKTLEQVERPSASLLLWRRSGALRALLPALEAQPAAQLHASDGLASPEATSDLGRARRRLHVRLGALLSGLAGRDITRLLRGLRFANRDVDRLTHVASVGGTLAATLEKEGSAGPVGDRTLRQWAALAGRTDLADALRIAMATACARRTPASEGGVAAWRSLYRRAVRAAYRDPVEIADLAVDGEDLMRDAGIRAGPQLGEALRTLRDWVLDDPARNGRELLLAQARELALPTHGEG